jgi:hypothetical protein
MYHRKNPTVISYHGNSRTHDTRAMPSGNYFPEYTFSDIPANSNYSHDQYAYWQGPRQRQDTCEYFRSTQNDKYYRAETQDELENRILSPGSSQFLHEITPERLAEDPGDEIAKYYNGWVKNLSDGRLAVNFARSRARVTKKANYLRINNQMHRYIMMTEVGTSGYFKY